MKVSKTGYKKNSKDKNEPALVIPSNQITMKGVEFPVFGTDDTGYSQMMYPGMDYSFPGNYVHELPMAKNGMSAPGPSKVIGGKLEISYDKDRNIYLRSLDGADWTKIEGDRAKEFRTKFAEHLPGYFDPAGSIKQISKKAAKQVGTKQQIVDDKPKYQEIPQHVEPTQEIQQAPQSPLQQVAAGVPPMLAKSAAQPGFGDQILSGIGNPEKIKQTKLQSKYQTSPDYHATPYSSVNQANKAYEKTVDYKLRYKNLNEYSTDDIPKIQEKLYNEGYLQKPEQIDLASFKTKEQITELQKKLAKFGLIDMLGKDGVNGVLNKETKDAAKRFNELNQTYKSGELDDMTKQAIKNFKNSTDAKNTMGLPVVNPTELYDPETGEPYTDKTYEAMNIFENSLKSKGYFLGDQGYDISESVASNPKVSFNFKLNPDPTTPFGMCAAYVNGTVCKDDVVGEEARDELGFKGSAWHMSENIQEKGGQLLYAGVPDRSSVNLNGKNEITGYLKSQLTSPEAQNQLRGIIGDGNMWGANTKVKPGDVVNIFYEGSNYTEEAYNQTKPLNNRFFTTHVGIVKADDNGTLYVEHNVHGNVEKDKLQDFADGKVKGNGKNRVSLISGITRPNYIDGVDNDARIPAGGISYYQTEEGQFNPKGALANQGDYLGQVISGEKTYKYLTTIEKNKDKLLKDIPISDTEFGKLMRVARVIPTLETYGGKDVAEQESSIGFSLQKGLQDALGKEKSTGFTKLKDSSNLGEDIRQNLYGNDDSQLADPVKAALPTFYLLSKNYLYLKEVANRNNLDVTSDELAKLAGLSYNQSIGKIAGELVDKGSYQKYYDYRVKTASDPGGNFKYRKVMDLYDKQTMRDGGITAPGRFKNPEGNWLSKYENGGPGDPTRVTTNANQYTTGNKNIFEESSTIQNPANIEDVTKMYTRSVNAPGKQERFMEYFQTPDSSSFKYSHPFFGQHEVVTSNPLLKKLGDKYFSSKFSMGGDISIPDLSRPTWLDKYQGGGAKDKNFRRSVDSKYTEGIQKMLNKTYGTGLSEDGVWGPLTEKAYQNHLEINNLQNQINKLDTKQQAFKNQDAALKKVNNTAKKSSTSVVVPKVENAKKQVESVQREAARVKSKMQETGAKSEAEVYAREKEMAAAQAKLTNQPTLNPAQDKTAGDYLSHAWDVVSNPITAFGYTARGEEIPWGFTQGERNPLEYATDAINPAFYANAAGRLADAATTGSTYTKTIPQALGATAGLLMNEEVPEEWNDEAVKTLGIIGDATVVSQGLKAVSEIGTAIRNAKSSNFLNVKQERVFPGMSNPKIARNLSLNYKTPLPDHHFKDSGEFLDWYKKTQNNRPFTKKEINFLNKELKERGILEVQRSNPLNPLPNLTRRMLIPEDYDWKKVLSEAAPNLVKSMKGMDNLYKDYTMGPGRLNAFNQWLGLPTKGTMYRVHPESFQNGKGLLYTTTGNSMKGVFDPELRRMVPKSDFTRPIGKDTFEELDIAVKAANKEPYQKQLQDMGYYDLDDFADETGIIVSRRPNTVIDFDKYTGSAGGASWVRVPIKGGGYEWTMRDTWDIQPFSRMARMPNFVRDIDVAKLIGAKNFDVNWNYRTSPKFNKVSNVNYPGKGWTVQKYGGWLNRYQDGSQVAANLPWINQSGQYKDPTGVGPTVAKAEELKQKKVAEAARKSPSSSNRLPSGAITPVMGPVEYALMAPVAASSIMKAAPIISSAVNAPIAGLPGVTAGNALAAGFAADAAVNRLPQIPGQVSRGEYTDAAINAATGLLDVGSAGMLNSLYKGATKAIKGVYTPSETDIVRDLLKKSNQYEIEKARNTKPVQPTISQNPYSRTYPELTKHDELVRDSYTSGRWPNEAGFWKWYNKKEHGIDYDRPIPKFFDPTEPGRLSDTADNLHTESFFDSSELSNINDQVKQGNTWLQDWFKNPATAKRIANTGFDESPLVKKNINDFTSNKNTVRFDPSLSSKVWTGNELGSYFPKANKAYVDAEHFSFMDGSKSIPSTVVHEGTHLTSAGELAYNQKLTDLTNDIFKGNDSKEFAKMFRTKDDINKINKLTSPAETHARIMQIRQQYGIKPEQIVDDRTINKIIEDGLSGKSPVSKNFFKLIENKDAFKKAMNTLPAIGAGVAIGTGGLQENKTGGSTKWLNRYQDGKEVSSIPQSWKDKYDWTPNVEEEYLQFKNDPNAPENLRFTDDMKDYNTRGMWDSLDRPSNWQQALDLHKQQQGYEWTPEDDGYYHAWSQHPGTGEWLKPRHHSTGWMNNMGYAFDPENTVVVNPEGFFGNETLQAYPKQKKKDGGQSQGEGYYDYINGYSGIFANGGVSSKQSSWLNKYK